MIAMADATTSSPDMKGAALIINAQFSRNGFKQQDSKTGFADDALLAKSRVAAASYKVNILCFHWQALLTEGPHCITQSHYMQS